MLILGQVMQLEARKVGMRFVEYYIPRRYLAQGEIIVKEIPTKGYYADEVLEACVPLTTERSWLSL